MELPSSRFSSQQPVAGSSPKEPSTMSTLTMRAPGSLLPSPRSSIWDDGPSISMPTRPRSQNDRIELPSIRQAIPELDLRSAPLEREPKEVITYSPPRGQIMPDASYVSSPSLMSKRRRLSPEDDASESRDYTVPRIYRSPRQSARGSNVPHSPSGRRRSQYSAGDYSNHASPYSATGPLPSIRASPSYEPIPRNDFRPTLPSLPSLTLERAPPAQVARARNWSDYALETPRPGAQSYPPASVPSHDPQASHSAYSSPTFAYGYHQPRGQQYSGSISLHHPSMERSPFTGPSYHHGSHDSHMYDMGMGSMSEGGKQRKRRGNLPKETTDKLRAWFVAHLQHPYPTEDEKQDLMRQTGLQMNQISNWFINARRRQLPAMINNARAESDARSARSSGDGVNANGILLGQDDQSGSEGGYDEDYENLGGRAAGSTTPSTAVQTGTPGGPMSVASMTTAKQES